jgi:glycosyltransferase involved in cell wall biosynthesis
VIVCTYNAARLPLLRSAIDGVLAQEPPADELVLVVDHNPELLELLRADYPDAVVVENAGKQGLSDARNTGIATATGDVLAFLDDDATPRPGWLAELVAPFADPTIAGVGGRAEPAWERGERPRWMPEELDWVVGCSYEGQAGGDVRNPIGASMALRAGVLEQVGPFSTDLGRVGTLPVGCEETELGLRINGAGHRIVLADRSVVDHFVPAERASVTYVLRRCYSEGISKAAVKRLTATLPVTGTLDPEKAYVGTLLKAVLRALVAGLRRRDAQAAAPAVLIPASGLAAVAGYVRGSAAAGRG